MRTIITQKPIRAPAARSQRSVANSTHQPRKEHPSMTKRPRLPDGAAHFVVHITKEHSCAGGVNQASDRRHQLPPPPCSPTATRRSRPASPRRTGRATTLTPVCSTWPTRRATLGACWTATRLTRTATTGMPSATRSAGSAPTRRRRRGTRRRATRRTPTAG